MANPDLTGTRVLVAGAESEVAREIATALGNAGAAVAIVATANDPDEAFAVQRLARKLGGPGQAVDGTNDMAVRVMVRQISKDLGGLDAIIACAPPEATKLIARYGGKELTRAGGRYLILIGEQDVDLEPESSERPAWTPVTIRPADPASAASAVLRALAGDALLD